MLCPVDSCSKQKCTGLSACSSLAVTSNSCTMADKADCTTLCSILGTVSSGHSLGSSKTQIPMVSSKMEQFSEDWSKRCLSYPCQGMLEYLLVLSSQYLLPLPWMAWTCCKWVRPLEINVLVRHTVTSCWNFHCPTLPETSKQWRYHRSVVTVDLSLWEWCLCSNTTGLQIVLCRWSQSTNHNCLWCKSSFA